MRATCLEKERAMSKSYYPLWDILRPGELWSVTAHVRIIYFIPPSKVLMQRFTNGLCVFPGGRCNLRDGDAIEALWRELREETHLSYRKWFVWDLVYSSRQFFVDWESNRDVYFVVEWGGWQDQLPIATLRLEDEDAQDVAGVEWLDLKDIVGNPRYQGVWYANVLEACHRAYPIILGWTDPLANASWSAPIMTENGLIWPEDGSNLCSLTKKAVV